MKKAKGLLRCFVAALLAVLVSVPAMAEDISVDLEIREKMFLAQTNEIYINASDYLGKTIKYEGMFYALQLEENDTKGMVFRYGPGCCGDDGVVGFEVRWDGDAVAMPTDNTWVEIVGALEAYDEEGIRYLRLNLYSLQALDQRGKETVSQ